MNENLKDILSNLHSEVDQETLLKYLQGHLSAEQQHEVEKNLLDDMFEADAVEGLQTIQDKSHIPALVEQLNRDLKNRTTKKKRRLFRREAKVEPWLLFAIVLILLLAIIAFFVIRQIGK
jgi:anti-sigma factor RsiW